MVNDFYQSILDSFFDEEIILFENLKRSYYYVTFVSGVVNSKIVETPDCLSIALIDAPTSFSDSEAISIDDSSFISKIELDKETNKIIRIHNDSVLSFSEESKKRILFEASLIGKRIVF